MTEPELIAHLATYELHEPVTTDDCKAIFDDLKPRLAAGSMLEVYIAGDWSRDRRKRIEVAIGPLHAQRIFEIAISG